jgi:hypothetical protein
VPLLIPRVCRAVLSANPGFIQSVFSDLDPRGTQSGSYRRRQMESPSTAPAPMSQWRHRAQGHGPDARQRKCFVETLGQEALALGPSRPPVRSSPPVEALPTLAPFGTALGSIDRADTIRDLLAVIFSTAALQASSPRRSQPSRLTASPRLIDRRGLGRTASGSASSPWPGMIALP